MKAPTNVVIGFLLWLTGVLFGGAITLAWADIRQQQVRGEVRQRLVEVHRLRQDLQTCQAWEPRSRRLMKTKGGESKDRR
jgi:hypothetical protein